MGPTPEFRWQAFFRHSHDPLFLLNRNRRILFVNRAWEDLTGLSFARVRGLACTRRKPVTPSDTDLVTRLLYPPPEVMEGHSTQVRRPGPQPGSSWDVDFLPFRDAESVLGILGKIATTAIAPAADGLLPESLQNLRAARGRRHRLETLHSHVPAMQRAVEQARVAANTTAPVLIVGEPGVGKRWLARAIHQLSPRREEPFAIIDCGKLPVEDLDKALFGERGLVRDGRAGTVYLHDPGLLSRDLQTRFIEALAEPQPRTPRLMAGSATDLRTEARSLRVLEEFRCRLGTLVIEAPSLRERLPDLPTLVELFLDRACEKKSSRPTLTAEAWELLRGYRWPGNLHELAEVLRGVCERAAGGRVGPSELPARLRLAAQPATPKTDQPPPLAAILEEAERRLIQIALRKANGNKTKAAELLGLWKPRLLRRMAALGMKDT